MTLAMITGASSGIGLELARCAIGDGCEVFIYSDEDNIHDAARLLYSDGAHTAAVQADLGTKAYLDSLCYALHDEWRDSRVTLTCLMPGPTDTPIFHRPENLLTDSPIAKSDCKYDVSVTARAGYDTMLAGDKGVVPRVLNKLIAMFAGVVLQSILAEMHRRGRNRNDFFSSYGGRAVRND